MKNLIVLLLIAMPTISFAAVDVNTALLKKLVLVGSGSQQVDKVNKVQGLVKSELEALGFQSELIPPPKEIKSGDLLVSTLKGASSQTITFLIHADTVFEPSAGFSGFRLSDDGSMAYGPGVIDDKGGIVVLISGLKEALAKGAPKYTLRVVSSPSEEVGSPGFESRFQEYSKDSILVLGFEPALENKNIISSRKGNAWFFIEVEGREAHAGRAHKDGINACVELAEKLAQISKLTNYAKNTTVSVGHMEGGQDKYNIVCGKASAKVDTRFETLKEQEQIKVKIAEILKTSRVHAANDRKSSKIVFKIESESPALAKSANTKYLKRYLAAIQVIEGASVVDEQSGGSADINSFSRPGRPILDGLGPVGGKMHTKDEFIYLPSLKTRAQALAQFLTGLE